MHPHGIKVARVRDTHGRILHLYGHLTILTLWRLYLLLLLDDGPSRAHGGVQPCYERGRVCKETPVSARQPQKDLVGELPEDTDLLSRDPVTP